MNTNSNTWTSKIYVLIVSAFCLLNLSGCDAEEKIKHTSTDAIALKKIVDLNIPANAILWEIYDSPEQSEGGFLPSSPDYTILIAQLDQVDQASIFSLPPGTKIHVGKDTSRPWLDQNFRDLLKSGSSDASSTIDTSSKSPCRPFSATYKKTNENAKGVICSVGKKALIYLILAGYF